MKRIAREEIAREALPGRYLQKAVGRDSAVDSERMTVCFCRYCAEVGPMEPHNHAEETVVILDARMGYIRRGSSKEQMEERIPLEQGMVLYFDELEWHVFEYDQGGHIDAVCIYGQVDNIRPEQIQQKRETEV